jgi:hypothetical protein
MTAEPISATRLDDSVVLDGNRVEIVNLSVDGAIVALARDAVGGGKHLELVVREALEVGASVLLHGSAKGTVDAVAAEVQRLLTALDEKSLRAESMRRMGQRVAAKGFDFEDALGPALEACYSPHEDILEVTGASPGIADEKVGDFVVTVNPRDTSGRDLKIVFEAKDRKLTVQKALAEIDAAMVNRGAQVGVMAFAHFAEAPLVGKPLRVFPGNRLMVVWETEGNDNSDLALEVCAQLARTLAIGVERDDVKLNRKMLNDRLAQLVSSIQRAAAIERGIRGARRGLDAAEAAYDDMRSEALAVLYELQDRV